MHCFVERRREGTTVQSWFPECKCQSFGCNGIHLFIDVTHTFPGFLISPTFSYCFWSSNQVRCTFVTFCADPEGEEKWSTAQRKVIIIKSRIIMSNDCMKWMKPAHRVNWRRSGTSITLRGKSCPSPNLQFLCLSSLQSLPPPQEKTKPKKTLEA